MPVTKKVKNIIHVLYLKLLLQALSSLGSHLSRLRYPVPGQHVGQCRYTSSLGDIGPGPDRLLPAASPVAVDLDGVVTLRHDHFDRIILGNEMNQ